MDIINLFNSNIVNDVGAIKIGIVLLIVLSVSSYVYMCILHNLDEFNPTANSESTVDMNPKHRNLILIIIYIYSQ